MKLAIKVWKDSLSLLRKHYILLAPFLLTAIAQVVVLYVLYILPRRPLVGILGPPVRAFFGELYLHYPHHIFLLPKLFYYARLCLGASVGILMTGMAIGMLWEANGGKKIRIVGNFAVALRRSLSLLAIWLTVFIISFVFNRLIQKITSGMQPSIALSCLQYIVAIIPQILFVYAMPSVIIEKNRFFKSIMRSFAVFKKFFGLTVILIFVPALLYIVTIILNYNAPAFINSFSPEFLIVLLSIEIVFSFIIDVFATVPPVLVFLKQKELKK